MTTACAPEPETVMVLPGVGLPNESFSVTVIVAAVCPSAGSEDGFAEIPALTAGGTLKVTEVVLARVTPSVVSTALKDKASALASVTEKMAVPLLTEVVALAGDICALPPEALSVTFLPLTRLPFASRRVTTMDTALAPSAGMLVGKGGTGPTSDNHGKMVEVEPLTVPTDVLLSRRYNWFMLGEPKPT